MTYSVQDRAPLPLRASLLGGQFVVEDVIGMGGFGITYRVLDVELDVSLAVKEFLPVDVAERHPSTLSVQPASREQTEWFAYGVDCFRDEARALARVRHPNVVSIRHFFRENGTAYLVTDLYRGQTVAQMLERSGGRLHFEPAVEIMLRVLNALSAAHGAGILHLDVKPDNIIVTDEGQVVLIDFGCARQIVSSFDTSVVGRTSGYASPEQYEMSGYLGPWSDVYGAAATLYRMIAGERLPDALDRLNADADANEIDDVPPGLAAVVSRAISLPMASRQHRVSELAADLDAALRPLAVGSSDAVGALDAEDDTLERAVPNDARVELPRWINDRPLGRVATHAAAIGQPGRTRKVFDTSRGGIQPPS